MSLVRIHPLPGVVGLIIRHVRRALAMGAALVGLLSARAAGQGVATASCPLGPASDRAGTFALVLSGGGARGLAHIGVLRVLDSLGVNPDLVVGTSMGALVGALYSGGLSGRQLDSLARALPLEALFRRYQPVTLMTAGDFRAPVSVLAPAFVLGIRGGVVRLQSPVAREPQINALFNQLLLRPNLAAAGDFDRLPRRFRAVATDVRSRSAVVLGDGDLAEAVRASIAIPVVFAPVQRDGRLLVDGGLSANEPIGVARQLAASRILAVDVGARLADSIDAANTASMLAYLVDELFTQPSESLGAGSLRIRPDVRAFNPLEFSHAAVTPLIDAGYRATAAALPGCLPARARARVVTPVVRAAEAAFIAERLARLAAEGVYETIWLRPRRADTVVAGAVAADARFSSLSFAPVATTAPERVAFGGVSYEGHEGARVWLAVQNLAPAGGRVAVGAMFGLGEWRQQLLFTATGVRRHPLPRPSDGAPGRPEQVRLPDPRSDAPPWSTLVRNLLRPELSVTGAREVVRLYDGRGRERDRPSTRDLFAFAGAIGAPTAAWRLVLGPAVHVWATHSIALPSDEEARALGGLARAARFFSPSSAGPDLDAVPTVAAEGIWLDRYRRASAHADLRFEVGSVIVRPLAAAGWGESLPLAALFTLGGAQGFPGLRVSERRGDEFAFASLALLHRLRGPVYLRGEVGHGRTALARARAPELLATAAGGWITGGELGLTADTPLGPIVLGAGVASNGRPVFKIRVGN